MVPHARMFPRPAPAQPRHRAGLAALLAIAGVAIANMGIARGAEYAAGAIAVDMSKPKGDSYTYGIGGGDTTAEAEGNAHKFCSEDGAKNCKLIVTYKVCGAAAGDDAGAAGGFGDTKGEATKNAMSKCGTSECKLIIADCN